MNLKHYSVGSLILICFSIGSFVNSPIKTNSNLNKQAIAKTSSVFNKSFVTEAISSSGPSVVTIETERKVISRNRSLSRPRILLEDDFELFLISQDLIDHKQELKESQKIH